LTIVSYLLRRKIKHFKRLLLQNSGVVVDPFYSLLNVVSCDLKQPVFFSEPPFWHSAPRDHRDGEAEKVAQDEKGGEGRN
jgi:hypothetical protein